MKYLSAYEQEAIVGEYLAIRQSPLLQIYPRAATDEFADQH